MYKINLDVTNSESSLSLQRLYTILFKRKKIILLVWAAVVATVAVGSLLMPHIFVASSKIIVERVMDADKSLLFGLSLRQEYEQYDWINTEIEIIDSQPVALRAVKALGLERAAGGENFSATDSVFHLANIAKKFRKNLLASSAKNSNVIDLSYEAESPELAARAVNQLVESYVSYRAELFDESATYKFFEKQMQVADEKLRQLEQHQAEFKQDREILSPEQQRGILLAKLADYDRSITAARTKRIGKEASLAVIKQQLRSEQNLSIPATETSDSPSQEKYIAKLRGDLLDMEIRREQLLQKFTPQYEEVVDLDQQIAATKAKIKNEIEQIVRMEEMSIKVLQAEEQLLETSVQKIQNELKEFAHKEYELSQLSRGIDDNREVFSMLLKQREEARIALAKLERGVKIKVISPAVAPTEPVRPNRVLNVAIALVVGLLAGLALAFLMEFFDRTIDAPDDLERLLNLPALGSVREIHRVEFDGKDR
jgi:uncharacterized protein involved in exopolysaccharide biosynthesis